jgi:hypothetical protein
LTPYSFHRGKTRGFCVTLCGKNGLIFSTVERIALIFSRVEKINPLNLSTMEKISAILSTVEKISLTVSTAERIEFQMSKRVKYYRIHGCALENSVWLSKDLFSFRKTCLALKSTVLYF